MKKAESKIKIRIRHLSFSYHGKKILADVNAEFPANRISTITGPYGSGKSTFLTVMNRLWEEVAGCSVSGTVEMEINGRMVDIHSDIVNIRQLRGKVEIVFQQPNPLPMSTYKNVAFPLELVHEDKETIRHEVKSALKQAHLWNEVKGRLDEDSPG